MPDYGESSYRRFLQGDKTALEKLLCAYSDALVRFCYSLVHHAAAAEDLAAESIAIVLTKHKPFADEAHLRAYLYQIAHHKSMDYLRQNKQFVPLEDVENVLGSGDAFASGLIYAMMNNYKPMDMVNFAVASSVLKHTIHGDANITDDARTIKEIMNQNFDIKR